MNNKPTKKSEALFRKAQEKKVVQTIGQRLLSEANDLKRTFESISIELNLDLNKFKDVSSGISSYDEAIDLAKILAANYPIRLSQLILDIPVHYHGIKIMTAKESASSKRVFNRLNGNNELTPYYEYRDTATTKSSPFKPEWIKELRVVENADPYNNDVAYNNGHFLHQMTAFIGPVNFYWEIDGEKYSKEMNTGSSNYITPFIKHSFASRDRAQESIIIAVTFSCDAGRARNEIYSLGTERMNSYVINNRNENEATTQIIKQILENKCLTKERLAYLIKESSFSLDCENLLDPWSKKSKDDLEDLASILNVTPSVFEVPKHDTDSEVLVKDKVEMDSFIFNSSNTSPDYIINSLVQNDRLPQVEAFEFQIISRDCNTSGTLRTSLHSYVYNYGAKSVQILWRFEGVEYSETLHSQDSLYVEPFIEHKFFVGGEERANVFVFRASGEISLSVQKEISSFASTDRIVESSPWFD